MMISPSHASVSLKTLPLPQLAPVKASLFDAVFGADPKFLASDPHVPWENAPG